MSETLAQRLIAALRTTAQAYAAGDQVAPCAVLWTDPQRLWECVMSVTTRESPDANGDALAVLAESITWERREEESPVASRRFGHDFGMDFFKNKRID